MRSKNLNDWVQTITGVAIVFGLMLVIWELQQSREATMSQLSSDAFQIQAQLGSAVIGEQSAEVLAKACYAPSELTDGELYVLDHFYGELVNRVRRILWLSKRGSFYSEAEVSIIGVGPLNYIMESTPGRAYLRTITVEPDLQAIVDKGLAEWNDESCAGFFDKWRDNIEQDLRG